MKIKTITCHDVYNTGASLQAYALVTYLNSLGHDAKIINYKPDYLSHHYSLTGIANPAYDKPFLREVYTVLKFPGRLKARCSRRKKEFDAFTAQLPMTAKSYFSNDSLKENPPVADLFIAGSDQIWNTVFQNGRDPAFYLDFAPAHSVRASYAASFSTEDIVEEYKPQIAKWLREMDYISVRERSGKEIIRRMGIDGVVQVLDPVFLLTAEKWKSIEKQINFANPYLFLYDFDNNPEIAKAAKEYAGEHNLKIFSVFPNKCADKCFANEGPQTFLALVRNSEFVISNSFHATAFALIFEKQFVVYNRMEAINTRMRDLLMMVNLEDRLIDNRYIPKERIQYEKVKQLLCKEIKHSKGYIDMILRKQDDR